MDQDNKLAGVVVSKLEPHRGVPLRGYIAMLAVRNEYRGQGIATKLVCMAIDAMIERDADEVHLPCPARLYKINRKRGKKKKGFPLRLLLTFYCLDSPRNRNHEHPRHETL